MSIVDWNLYPNFSEDEFKCRGKHCCGGSNLILPRYMDALQGLRTACGFGFPINSGYRCPIHDGKEGEHTFGEASDIGVLGHEAYVVLKLAPSFGFTRIGIKQHGLRSGRFIHLGMIKNEKFPSPWIWSYG